MTGCVQAILPFESTILAQHSFQKISRQHNHNFWDRSTQDFSYADRISKPRDLQCFLVEYDSVALVRGVKRNFGEGIGPKHFLWRVDD